MDSFIVRIFISIFLNPGWYARLTTFRQEEHIDQRRIDINKVSSNRKCDAEKELAVSIFTSIDLTHGRKTTQKDLLYTDIF